MRAQFVQGHSRRWDRLTDLERRSRSAEIAADEVTAQGYPLLASLAQHRQVALVLASGKATRTFPADKRTSKIAPLNGTSDTAVIPERSP